MVELAAYRSSKPEAPDRFRLSTSCRHGAMAAQLFRNQQVSGSSPDDGLRVKLERFHGGLISREHGFKSHTRDFIAP